MEDGWRLLRRERLVSAAAAAAAAAACPNPPLLLELKTDSGVGGALRGEVREGVTEQGLQGGSNLWKTF